VVRRLAPSGCLSMDYAPSVERVRAVKSPSFTAAFFAKAAVRKRRPRHGRSAWKAHGGWARVSLFPDPGPAITNSGGAANPRAAPCSTAPRCSGLRVSR
jgi:hypothetical protein